MSNLLDSTSIVSQTQLGATYIGDERCEFRVWAPLAEQVRVEIVAPAKRSVPLARSEGGYWQGVVEALAPGALYRYRLDDNRVFPDPASKSQPEGVHGPSEVIRDDFPWSDAGWHGQSIEDYVIYELHVGTFTAEGTFDEAAKHLHSLKTLGITAIEVMPVAQFPGSRNWGYDGVYPFAVQQSYGGPAGFKRFIDAAHREGLAVILDVVYNHLGPEGNYLGQFAPYFTARYQTPWGEAINFDGPDALGVREYFLQNALYWIRDFHLDGLRLDAVQAIIDSSSPHILTEIADLVHNYAQDRERTATVIAESDLNEPRIVCAGELGGYGLDAQWSDDFHHALHAVLTGERVGYYEDFGLVDDVAKALSRGFVYSGQYSKHRGRSHGTDPADIPGRAFVVCVQNHDQIGNRMLGERFSHLVAKDEVKLAAAILLLAPYVPLLFMGQEYGDTAPFLYFVSHSDPALVQGVRDGRKKEFAAFSWQGDVPDPQSEDTFLRCKLNHHLQVQGWHAVLREWYRKLLQLRKEYPALASLDRKTSAVDVVGSGNTIVMRRWTRNLEVVSVFHLGSEPEAVEVALCQPIWTVALDSAAAQWLGKGSGVPNTLEVDSRVRLQLQPKQCVVLTSGTA